MWTPRSPDRLLALVLAAWLAPAAAAPDPAAAQRERITRERQAVEREARAAQQACATQFAITDCVNRAKAERRERLRPLDRELALLDDELRKRRAAERLAQLQQRQASRPETPPEVSVRTRKASAPDAASAASAPPRPPQRSPAALQAAASQADAAAAQRAAAAARRVEQAQAHRAVVEQKNVERARQREPAKPLPQPAAASR